MARGQPEPPSIPLRKQLSAVLTQLSLLNRQLNLLNRNEGHVSIEPERISHSTARYSRYDSLQTGGISMTKWPPSRADGACRIFYACLALLTQDRCPSGTVSFLLHASSIFDLYS